MGGARCEQVRVLRAGTLHARLEGHALRYIRFANVEVLRALQFAMRGAGWETHPFDVRSTRIRETSDYFEVVIDGTTGPSGDELDVSIAIEGHASGRLTYTTIASVRRAVETNRTGIVMLHPLSVSGERVVAEHDDGTLSESRFPERIEPYQPFLALRALRHAIGDQVEVAIRMTGDVFEMEDQRNWSDASFKTYSRPIALPWPYPLAAGETYVQRVDIDVRPLTSPVAVDDPRIAREQGLEQGPGQDFDAHAPGRSQPIRIQIGAATDTRLPSIGLGIDADADVCDASHVDLLGVLRPNHLVATICSDDDAASLALRFKRIASLTASAGADLVLNVILACRDTPDAELETVRHAMHAAGVAPGAVFVTPAVDLKAVLPGSPWPAAPSLESLYDAARRVFGPAKIGGGTLAYFAELNRKRPDPAALDFIGFTTCPIVHVADDESVVETLSCIEFIARSVKALFPDVPFWVGPSSIAMRANPYGAQTPANPSRLKIAQTHDDVRQFESFAAAWALGYIAEFAKHGAQRIGVAELTGFSGITLASNGRLELSALGHLLAALYRVTGYRLLDVSAAYPAGSTAVLAVDDGAVHRVWIANLTPERICYHVDHGSNPHRRVEVDGYSVAPIVLEVC
ncbi:hypothetical protein D7S86_15870 [Pararobbsia silviterrae]|uniref:Uncharacterized protein n=2 Tax=Pararobbsia silviterrae TaxID=1792498 RepID=A0A494XV71_9BURK|nr:hypothetical protein D7S86_15870 [Pararobbsia silviterrae]